jgi:flagellar L-ring protein precursor FlgH
MIGRIARRMLLLLLASGILLATSAVEAEAQSTSATSSGPASAPQGSPEPAAGGGAPRRAGASIFARAPVERPAVQKQDLILVEVVERTTARGNSRENNRSNASTDLEIASYLKFDDGNLVNAPNPLNLDIEADKEREVREQNQRSVDIRTRITARVIDVLPNGNLRIEARKERRINEELTAMTLTGEVRIDDVSEDMVVLSDRVADLKLVYSAADPRTKRTKRNIVERVWQFLWPF